MSDFKISVVIPTHNENDDSKLFNMAASYPKSPFIEYLIVDSNTDPDVLNRLNRSDFRVIATQPGTRAEKLNLGFKKSSGGLVLFHHPRSLVDSEGLSFLLSNSKTLKWGGFAHKFDLDRPGLKFTSWYSNNIRPKFSKIIYLDHCIFFQRTLLTTAIPNVPIFEDTELSKILMKSGRPTLLPFVSETSAIRFEKNGFWKQGLLNQKMKVEYHLGRSRKKMNDQYETDLNLNG